MSAEGSPQPEASFLARPLGLVTRLVLRAPGLTLATGLLLALASTLLAANWLGVRTSRLDLINPRSSYNQRWLEYLDEFGDRDDAVVVVEGAGPEQIVPVLNELAGALSGPDEPFDDVLHKKDLSGVGQKGLHFLSLQELIRIEQFLDQLEPVLAGDWSALTLSHLFQQTNPHVFQPAAADGTWSASQRDKAALALGLVSGLEQALQSQPAYQSPWPKIIEPPEELQRFDGEYLLADDGRLGFLLVRFRDRAERFDRDSRAVDRLRQWIGQIQRRHEPVRIGLTGLPVLENDEMRTSQNDMLRASLLSLLGVACLFVAGFGGLRHPLLTVLALVIAMAWSFGYVTLSVGHLNILSVSFGVILIGLGVDFGIHYVARYLQLRALVGQPATALVQTATSVGPGIVIGGLTTAIAFCTAMLTEFTGVAELGRIAGGGILLCLAATLLVLPAILYLADRHRPDRRVPPVLPVARWCQPLADRPGLVLWLVGGLTGLMAVGLSGLRYDHNLLNLQSPKLESVQLERRLLTESDQSVWFAVSMADSPVVLQQRKARFDRLESVERTEDILSLVPPPDPAKQHRIAAIAERLGDLPEQPPLIPVPSRRALFDALLRTETWLAEGRPGTGAGDRARPMDRLLRLLDALPAAEASRRLSHYQQQLAADLLHRLYLLRGMADPVPPRLEDLPAGLRARFVGHRGRHLLKVYAHGDIWDMEALERFVRQVEAVDGRITGHPIQTYYASRQMQQSYLHAAIYALLAVAIVLVLDFRSIRDCLLALLPMGLGMVLLFGLLGLLGLPLNPANMIVLPLILGIGIDDGVHVVHDFRRRQGPYRLGSSTATAILITSLTTMVGFGSMMFASHQGLRSLGQVLTLGVFCCLGTSLLVLPALLSWMSRQRPWATADQDRGPSPESSSEQSSAAPRAAQRAAAAPAIRPRRVKVTSQNP